MSELHEFAGVVDRAIETMDKGSVTVKQAIDRINLLGLQVELYRGILKRVAAESNEEHIQRLANNGL